MEFTCPIGPESDEGNLQCHMCKTICRSWGSIYQHYRRQHTIPLENLNAHFIGVKYAESRRTKIVQMSDLERSMVASVEGNDEVFRCIPCNITLRKRSARSHFLTGTETHRKLTDSDMKGWVVLFDAGALSRQHPENMKLTECCKQPAAAAGTSHLPMDASKDTESDDELALAEGKTEDAPCATVDVCVQFLGAKPKAAPPPGIGHSEGGALALAEGSTEEAPCATVDVCMQFLGAKPTAAPPPGIGHSEGGALSDLAARVEELTTEVTRAARPATLEVVPPTLTINDDATDWTHSTSKKLRENFSLTCRTIDTVAYDDFDRYLRVNLNQEPGTRKGYQLGITRLLNIVSVDQEHNGGGTVDFKAYLVALYKTNLLYAVMDYPLMDLKYGWARQIVFALEHFCKFGIYEATRMELPKTKWCIEQLLAETMQPWKNRAHEAKRFQSADKEEIDALRLEKLPPAEECKAAVRLAMCDLAIISKQAAESGSDLTTKEKVLANTALAGILAYGAFVGRSGEWHGMEREKVNSKMEKGDNKIVCGKHKTGKYYGSIAKWVPPGLREALLVYCRLPNKSSVKLFEPAQELAGGAAYFHFGPALKAFGKYYTPKYEYPRINLLRKMFHSLLVNESREGHLMNLIGKADGHSAAIGMKTYALSGPSQDMAVGELIYRKVFGDPVPWPSHEEINSRRGLTETLVIAVCATMNACGEHGECESDDEAMDDIERSADELAAAGLAPIADAEDEARGGDAFDPDTGDAHAATERQKWEDCRNAAAQSANQSGAAATSKDVHAPTADTADTMGEQRTEVGSSTYVPPLTDSVATEPDVRGQKRRNDGRPMRASPTGPKTEVAGVEPRSSSSPASRASTAGPRLALPPLLLGPAGSAKRMTDEDAKLNQIAKAAFRKVALPEPYKGRYYMEPGEQQWATDAHDIYMESNGGDKATNPWFDQLYQFGVHTGVLNASASPAGLRSLIGRHVKGLDNHGKGSQPRK